MDLLPMLSGAILIVTAGSLVFALFTYLAYKARERRRPRRPSPRDGDEARFFHRYDGETTHG